MGIQLLGASTGLSASDLITFPQWTLLASYTTNSANSLTNISNIPQTYSVLRIFCPRAYTATNSVLYARFNNNSTSGIYHRSGVTRRGSAGNSHIFEMGYSAFNLSVYGSSYATEHSFDLIIPNYTSSTDNKLISGKTYYNDSTAFSDEFNGVFANTSPITRIDIASSGNSGATTANFTSGYSGLGIFVYGGR